MTREEFLNLKVGDEIYVNHTYDPRKILSFNADKTIGYLPNGSMIAINLHDYYTLVKPKMKFEVGKQYRNKISGSIFECIALTVDNLPIIISLLYKKNVFIIKEETKGNWEEYNPPVIHTRYVHWFKLVNGGIATYTMSDKDYTISDGTLLKTDVVTYTEEK